MTGDLFLRLLLLKATTVKQLFFGTINSDRCLNHEMPRRINNVSDEKAYELVWVNGMTPFEDCSYVFQPARVNGYLDEHKICVDAVTYNVHDCGILVYISIQRGREGWRYFDVVEIYSCGEKPQEVCGYYGGYFKVELFSGSLEGKTKFPTLNNFKLLVKVVSNSSSTDYIIAGGVTGGIWLTATVIIIVCVVCVCKRRHSTCYDRIFSNCTHCADQTDGDGAMTTGLRPSRQPYLTEAYPMQLMNHAEQNYVNSECSDNSQRMDNNQCVDNSQRIDNRQCTDNSQRIDNRQCTDNSQRIDNRQCTDNRQSMDNGERIDNQSVSNNQSIDNNESIDNNQSIDNSQCMENRQCLDNGESIDNQSVSNNQSIDNNESIDNNQSIDNSKCMENRQCLDNGESIDNNQSVSNNQSIVNRQCLDNNPCMDNCQCMDDNQYVYLTISEYDETQYGIFI